MKTELEDLVTAGDSVSAAALIMEIRGGTGGEGAGLFAGDLYNMYSRYVDIRGWSQEILDVSPGENGASRKSSSRSPAKGPSTAASSRVGGIGSARSGHRKPKAGLPTSAATVAVLPEAEEVRS